jgi:predicted small lipoprotein YifL
MRRILLSLMAVVFVSACGSAEPIWAPDADVARARYSQSGPSSITLYTVEATRDGSGAHAGMLINGSQRVMFDPAGTWQHPRLPERNDVHFGMTPLMVDFYEDYHARETFNVIAQTIEVSPEVAELALRRAMEYGAVPKAQCTKATSSILRGVPGFEEMPNTWYPNTLRRAFGALPGVKTRMITDTDTNNNHGVLLVQAGDPRLQ